jgi:hypothetical protein
VVFQRLVVALLGHDVGVLLAFELGRHCLGGRGRVLRRGCSFVWSLGWGRSFVWSPRLLLPVGGVLVCLLLCLGALVCLVSVVGALLGHDVGVLLAFELGLL